MRVLTRRNGAVAASSAVALCLLGCGSSTMTSRTSEPLQRTAAASCVGLTGPEQRAAARVIVTGRMLPGQSTRLRGREVLVSPARMRVGHYLKGSGPSVIEVQTGVQSTGGGTQIAEDGIMPAAGQLWEIYSDSKTMPLPTSTCAGSKALTPVRRGPTGPPPSLPGKLVAQINLVPPQSQPPPRGIAYVARNGRLYYLRVRAEGVQPLGRNAAYAVWLFRRPGSAELLGFVNPGPDRYHRLNTEGTIPADASHYRELLLTFETRSNPHRPGRIVVEGSWPLRAMGG